LQSQIRPYDDLRRETTPQLETTLALSVVVRWEPVRTAVNGTLVARPVRMTLAAPWCRRFNHERRVRLLLGDHGIVAKSPKGLRQVGH
jgi:hypothetical protein